MIGKYGEQYKGIGKEPINIANLPVSVNLLLTYDIIHLSLS